MSLSILLDEDPKLFLSLVELLQEALLIELLHNMIYHYDTIGQSEKIIQILENML